MNREGRTVDREHRDGAQSALRALGRFMQQRGLKHSRQREVVAEAFYRMGGHISVDALVTRVRQLDPHVSVATVYRTMKLLAECGLAVARQFEDGRTRYEPAPVHHHDHLICKLCGRIVEFENPQIEELQVGVARSHGFEVESHRFELYGRCASCRAPGSRSAEEAQ
jgi:Fur family transcriptional regulator, ferric uptake regulator